MTHADPLAGAISASTGSRPRDNELDLFGLTHPGHVRTENQDHFLLGTIHPQVVIHATSLPAAERLPVHGERLATIMLVADGVGGGSEGGEASQLAVESITRYVSSTMRCGHQAGTTADEEFLASLRAAALEAHAAVLAQAAGRDLPRVMATTLTLVIAVWPWAYVVQVGDSRCYFYASGALRQVTRDQTVAARQRSAALQRRTHQARFGRRDRRAPAHDDVLGTGLPGPGGAGARARRDRQRHGARGTGHRRLNRRPRAADESDARRRRKRMPPAPCACSDPADYCPPPPPVRCAVRPPELPDDEPALPDEPDDEPPP
ncbi:MAG: hypothetical protein B7Z72_03590, partial [Gemmatimonadetes bacterium 21-71-4]